MHFVTVFTTFLCDLTNFSQPITEIAKVAKFTK